MASKETKQQVKTGDNKGARRGKAQERISFARTPNAAPYPGLLDIQTDAFKRFARINTTPEERMREGLYKVFLENFPIQDARNNYELQFLDYQLQPPRYTPDECIRMGYTYATRLWAKFRLIQKDEEQAAEVENVSLGLIPYMTEKASFIINGAERVVVSQLHRSPGVFFDKSIHQNGSVLYSARIIPMKGAWIEFAQDLQNTMYAYIDRKKKIPVTTLLRAIGFSDDKAILDAFGLAEEVKVTKTNLKKAMGRRLAGRIAKTWQEDFVDEDTGEVVSIERIELILDRDTLIGEAEAETILDSGEKSILLRREGEEDYQTIFETLHRDPCTSSREAINFIYRQLRGADPQDEAQARETVQGLFFSDKRYDLGDVGRYRLNQRLGTKSEERVLTLEDITEIIKQLVLLQNGKREVDDIDHLQNRRVRTVGEQLQNLIAVGLSRMARTCKERMNVREGENFSPSDLINVKTITSVVNSFFGANPLSQFMDQTNPLAEITHKRRLSALGPGGLTRERAGFEVRDVHYSHYGRLCPIESPEGPNIGLISSLSLYAHISELGFIETPMLNARTGEIESMGPDREEHQRVAEAQTLETLHNTPRQMVRQNADFFEAAPDQVDYIDVSKQTFASLAAALIPFLEHDDAHRALMGSNMMRQAVPLLEPEVPIVGTGLEGKAALDSQDMIKSPCHGRVIEVDAQHIKMERLDTEEFLTVQKYVDLPLPKFQKTNQGMAIDLKPIVEVGDEVQEGELLTEGYCTKDGELALGRNLLVAYMPWKGYNYEDGIVISESLIKNDWMTSVSVDEYSLQVRETKRGAEELTADIPNVSEEATKYLDQDGIIKVGTRVKPGDILIGKVSPKGETDPTPEEKLLRAIFGEKAGDVKDNSLRANPSLYGVVVDRCLFQKAEKSASSRAADKVTIQKLESEAEQSLTELKHLLVDKLMKTLKGKKSNLVKNVLGETVFQKGSNFQRKALENVEYESVYLENWTTEPEVNEQVKKLCLDYLRIQNETQSRLARNIQHIQIGDELPSGVMKLAKVWIAKKRKIGVGDKMAGRHGNKGIVSKVVRVEDMPFLEDGTPVDIVLNPLGVPSRMNLGQIFEAVLGAAGKRLGVRFSSPIFDGATLEDLEEWTNKAGLPHLCSTQLYDGETGEKFDQLTTVGITYMLKLGHMVEDKMHARSIGPYSLITQQPLGGKAQFGGQRFGEMEVWALEAFGASQILREMLTIKSDDVEGRAKAYDAIVKGEPLPGPSLPESLNVLLHELQGLGLKVTMQ